MLYHLDVLKVIGRNKTLFEEEKDLLQKDFKEEIEKSSFLVIGGAGSIGKSTVKTLISFNPKKIHIVDINENNSTELIRDLRSSNIIKSTEIRAFIVDFGSKEFERLYLNQGPYDFVMNFSALKHVRSEKDPYTLMRMIEVNILNVAKLIEILKKNPPKVFFSVSTDKAANPANMMGASKRMMELLLIGNSERVHTTSSRFANVAFSEGSLLWGFKKRLENWQPIACPKNIRRYFITLEESGVLCLASTFLANSGEIFVPKKDNNLIAIPLTQVVENFLVQLGFEPYYTQDAGEAISKAAELIKQNKWPVVLTEPDTTGEKEMEELYSEDEIIDTTRFSDTTVVLPTQRDKAKETAELFLWDLKTLRNLAFTREDLIKLLKNYLPNFKHLDTGKFLDERM